MKTRFPAGKMGVNDYQKKKVGVNVDELNSKLWNID